jgi:16S rRNA (cytosine967-C5)-methyltransferase
MRVRMQLDTRKGALGARRLAWEVLWRTQRQGAYPDLLLAAILNRERDLPREERALAHELVMGTLRWQQCLDGVLQKVSDRSLSRLPIKLLVVLRVGAYQLLYLDRIPPSAAVNESVELAKSEGLAHAAPYVNGVLRAVARGGKALLAVDSSLPPSDRISQQTSHPLWMVERWMAQWGEAETGRLCEANNRVPPVTLRTNTMKISREELSRVLREEGMKTEATRFSPEGLRVLRLTQPLGRQASFGRGEFQVQDEASQLVSHWLEVTPGHRVLDACAAPGGKSAHMAQLMEDRGKVVAVDVHRGRLSLVDRECGRLGITCVETLQADLTRPGAGPPGPFDRILLDAPCSGLGVLRRHPDAKWRRSSEDMERMADVQRALLRNLLPRLGRKGILVYSVCTHTKEETEGVLEAGLREADGMELLASAHGLPAEAQILVGSDGLFRSFPHRHDTDGFTAFRLRKG